MIMSTLYNLYFHPLSHLPGPFFSRISSLASSYHAIKGDRHIWIWQQFQVYGHKFRAAPNVVLFDSPDAYNTIYSNKSNVKRTNFYDAWSRNKDDVNTLGTSDQELHAKRRRLLNIALSDRCVKAAVPFISRHIDRWHELLLGEGKEDSHDWSEYRDMKTWSDYLVFDVLGDLCFGADLRTKEPGENEFKKIPQAFDTFFVFNYAVSVLYVGIGGCFLRAVAPCSYKQITRTPLLDAIVWLKPRGLDRLVEATMPQGIKDHYAFLENAVRQRVADEEKRRAQGRPVKREDMLHFLITAQDPDTGKPACGLKELVAEANLLVLAGADTTSVTLCSLLFYITHNERVYLKLVKEIRETFASPEDIVFNPALLNCTYLRACIDETLRLAPAGPSELPRQILPGGMQIEGDFYPEGTIVGTPNWAMGRNEEHYGDACTFRPERWIASSELHSYNPESEVLRLKRGLHTFLKGPGDCAGQKLAVLELCIIVAGTLWRMDVRLAPGTHVGEGRPELGWGRRDPRQYMLKDAYISIRVGPILQFRPRREG
jgi:cytochrome P450